MLFSVIITCYNLDAYIAEAIDSVISQGYDSRLYEIVVVDDCSTDGSAEIIKLYGNVRYLRPERNLGVLMATVLGLENTTGELVFFLDGDDVWGSSKLSAVVERFRVNPRLALVTHDLNYIDGLGRVLDRKSRPEEVMAAIPASQEDTMIRNGILLHRDYVWLGSAYAIHRSLGRVEGFCSFAKKLPDPFNTYQDWPLAFWVASQPGVTLGYVPTKLFHYRLHGANHSGDARDLQRARRNFLRAKNTVQALLDIALLHQAGAIVIGVTDRKLAYCTYLTDLYNDRKSKAVTGFFQSIPYFAISHLSVSKELLRFCVITILGATRATWLKSRFLK